MGQIVWGFPGIGKSSVADGVRIVDVDDNLFRFVGAEADILHGHVGSYPYNPDYPKNYIDYVNGQNAEIVLVNCHISILEHFENPILIYPDASLKEEYLKRYKKRGDNKSFIEYMDTEFDGMVKVIEESEYRKYKINENNVFFKDILGEGGEEMEYLNQELVRMTKNNLPEEMLRFIKEGTDVNYKDKFGVPVLHWATNHANSHTIELLVEHGADVNAQNKNGMTKLMMAASYGDNHMVSYLLKHGANACLKANDGRDALSYAKERLAFLEDSAKAEKDKCEKLISILEKAMVRRKPEQSLDEKIALVGRKNKEKDIKKDSLLLRKNFKKCHGGRNEDIY